MSNLDYRKSCLLSEIETSIRLIKKGMGDLQKIDGANDFYHAPLLMLSSGFERLMKCLLCLALMDDIGEFEEPPYETTRRRGHNLEYLLGKLLLICEEKDYSSKFPAAKADIDFVTYDEHFREMIILLSDFAQGGRYYNLDVVIDGTSEFDNPEEIVGEIEGTYTKNSDLLLKKLLNGDIDSVYKEIFHELIIILEKFARVLARLFTLAEFGDFARQASPLVHDYLMLRNEELGTRDYQNL